MISSDASWDQHIADCRWATLTTLRRNGSPVSSIVAYARDGDELVVSTPRPTFKVQCISHNSMVNLCAFNNAEPFNYVSIEGRAIIEQEELVRTTRLVFANIEGTGYGEPEDLEAWLRDDERVILRIIPERVFGVIR